MMEQANVQLDGGEWLTRIATELRERVSAPLRTAIAPLTQPVELTPALSAERKTMRTHRGHVLSYYEDRRKHGEGRPLVLVHSVNACASAAEMRPLFDHYRQTRPVYAVDLPGFGFSERGALEYTPEAYAAELTELLARVKDRDHDAPDVVALSLGCELMARVAGTRKDLVHSLAFVSPTGLGRHERRAHPLSARALSAKRWWSPLLFGAIVSRPSIRYYLGKSFVGPVDGALRDYDYATSHQPGAKDAPLAFLSGNLFTPDIFATYAALERPVLAIYDKDGFVDLDRLPELAEESAMWSLTRIAPTRGMPHFEKLDETTAALDEFWGHHAHGR